VRRTSEIWCAAFFILIISEITKQGVFTAFLSAGNPASLENSGFLL